METTYIVKSIEINARTNDQDIKSETPKSWMDKPYSWEELNKIAHLTVDKIKNHYEQFTFQKLVVTLNYTIFGGDDVQYCIDCGYDEEGEVYCS
jgi:hypothetical protein